MSEFMREALTPLGPIEPPVPARLPRLPGGFVWHGVTYRVARVVEEWSEARAEGGQAAGDRHVRRQCYRLRMSDGALWTVYSTRQMERAVSPRTRWFLCDIAGVVTSS